VIARVRMNSWVTNGVRVHRRTRHMESIPGVRPCVASAFPLGPPPADLAWVQSTICLLLQRPHILCI
jgi:hypothetical protein